MCVCAHTCAYVQVPTEAKGVRSPEAGVISDCKHPTRVLAPNSGPLREQ